MKKGLLIIPTVLAFTVQVIMMFIVWKHNTQCEIHCSEFVDSGYTQINGVYIDFTYWFTIGFSWFALTFLLTFAIINIICKN